MMAYCESCGWLELPDDIQILGKPKGKRFVVFEGRAHTLLAGKRLEKMKLKNPPPEEKV